MTRLTSYGIFLLHKLLVPWLVKKLPTFYGTWWFVTKFTTASTWPYPKPDPSSPCPPKIFLEGSLQYYPPIYAQVFQAVSVKFPHQNSVSISPFSHKCHMPYPGHSSRSEKWHNFWWGIQTRIFLIRQFPPVWSGCNSKFKVSLQIKLYEKTNQI